MNLPNILPPSDLLRQVEGVESGLRQQRRLGILGWTGLTLSVAAQTTVLILNSQYAQSLWSALSHLNIPDLIRVIGPRWPMVIFLPLVVLFAVLVTWNRFWLKESQEPFRFTYFVEEFVPVSAESTTAEMAEVRFSLNRRLSERIARLSLLKEAPAESPDGIRRESHVHVSATYLVKRERDDAGKRVLEITPWVRIGPVGRPDSLAHPVRVSLDQGEGAGGSIGSVDQGEGAGWSIGSVPPSRRRSNPVDALDVKLTPPLIEQVLERLYFSVASQIYAQIRKDVQRKIDLLPTPSFRAIAYFYEALDHARSNTVDAYDEARKLYDAALQLFDPSWAPLRQARLPRLLGRCLQLLSHDLTWVRVKLSWVLPRVGSREVMIARAEIGYANMLLNRTALAALSGQRLNTVFEARPVMRRAVDRLRRLPSDVPGRTEALFAAYCSRALAESSLGAIQKAKRFLNQARDLSIGREGRDLPRPEQDSRWLFVAAELESNILDALDQYRRAVELDPTFELARFTLAVQSERLWRRRQSFEPAVADKVIEGYRELLRLNPGNVAASANIGYMLWLLEKLDDAKKAFDQGREYKEVKPETYVAELDYGLARVAAEKGRFSDAYHHYIDAVTAILALGLSHSGRATTAGQYYFELISPAMLKRFIGYRRNVFHELRKDGEFRSPGEIANRIGKAIWAFVLNDYGEAEYAYYSRTGDWKRLRAARKAFEQAVQTNPGFILPYYNLAVAGQSPEKNLRTAMDKKPNWADAKLAYVQTLYDAAGESLKLAERKEFEANEEEERAATRTVQKPDDLATDIPAGPRGATTEAKVRAAQDLADAARKDADRRTAEAGAKAQIAADEMNRLEELLPPWLWVSGQSHEFNRALLRDRRLIRERVWEKELDTLQAGVLQLWATLEFKGRGTDANRQGIARRRDLLEHLREHYWHEDFELLRVLRDADPAREAEYTKVIRSAVTRWLEMEPSYNTLTWVEYVFRTMAPDVDACSAVYSRTSRQANLLPHTYGWLQTELKDLGQRFAEDKKWGQMAEAYGAAAEASTRGGTVGERAVCRLGLAHALWRMEKYDDAKETLESISADARVAVEGRLLSTSWRTDLARQLIDAPMRPEPYAELKQCFEVPLDSVDDDPVARLDARRAAWLLVRDRKPWWTSDTAVRIPLVMPILLTADPWVFPKLGESVEAKHLIEEAFPRLRQRIHEHFGVLIPGIRLDVNASLTGGGYVIALMEVEAATDRVLLKYKFCPDVEACLRLGLTGVKRVGPSGKEGMWLLEATLKPAASEKLPLLDPYDYLTSHLEAVLTKQLAMFLGVDEVRHLLEIFGAASSEQGRSVVEAVPDPDSRLLLTRVLRALVVEGIPITDLETILDTFASVKPYQHDLEDIVAAVRVALASQISQLVLGRDIRRLSHKLEQEIESYIREVGGKRFLALPAAWPERLRATLPPELGTDPDATILVVRSARARPYLRRLLAEAFPTVLVVAEAELADARDLIPEIMHDVASPARDEHT